MTTHIFSIPCTLPLQQQQQQLISENTHTSLEVEVPAEKGESEHPEGLIADLAWILLLGAIVTIIFKKLRQPVVLGYIIAGFLASPKFTLLPSISTFSNIDFWAELGIVVLMFTLGLEFSFKKLVNSGVSAIFTALIIILGMTFAGYGVGQLLHLGNINSIFLGGMLSMSSTTIILKAFTDLGLRQKKFASLVLAVLIIEDLFAVLMLVLLSSLAMGNVQGTELLFSVAKLMFFLIVWFVVGVYVLPTFLQRTNDYLNSETLLVVSMGLCFGMAVLSVWCGFSLELGAFVTGSILAGTILAERIERVVQPVKDLFGAVFFISVGMMVDPGVIAQYWPEILLLAAVVIVGMTIFGTLGMLATGQSLRVAMEAGFSLTQVGEFSFIIASLGMSLGVLQPTLYPIIVAVSVITIFTTPYFIRIANPAYRLVLKVLPPKLHFLIERYTKEASTANNATKKLWQVILTRYIWRIVLYSALLTAIILASRLWLFPMLEELFKSWGHFAATIITLLAMSPFLGALSFSSTKPREKQELHKTTALVGVPLLAMRIFRYLVALFFIIYLVSRAYTMSEAWLAGVGCLILTVIVMSSKAAGRYHKMERKFMDNLNARENTRLGLHNNLVDDLHQAYIEVGAGSPFVGDRIADSGLRRDYGVSLSSIRRGMELIPLPTPAMRIFPGDILGIIGTDSQIKKLNDDILASEHAHEHSINTGIRVELRNVTLSDTSPLVGKQLRQLNMRDDYDAMIVKVNPFGTEQMLTPTPDTVLSHGDTLWIVGDPKKIQNLSND